MSCINCGVTTINNGICGDCHNDYMHNFSEENKKKIKSNLFETVYKELKFNKKKPKYNFHSGMITGILLDQMSILQVLWLKNPKTEKIQSSMNHIIYCAQTLTRDYDWNMYDIDQAMSRYFGGEK